MPIYEATVEIPVGLTPQQLDELIEGLRTYGHPQIVYRIEAPNRTAAAESIAEETGHLMPYRRDPIDWWRERLRALRGARAKEGI